MNIVLIPCYNRPEFLKVCLEHIKNANGADKLRYHFAVEYGAHPDVLKIIESFPFQKTMNIRKERMSKGNQRNVMDGYREAFVRASFEGLEWNDFDLIFNIEPDIFISKGFFEFHLKAHELCPDAFSVSACHNQNWTRKVPNYLDKVYYHPSFQSLGISFRMDVVEQIVKHSVPEFYQSPGPYLDQKHFPHSKRRGIHHEQAGLIHRIQEATKTQSVYPCNPLAYHAGFYGVNRPADKLVGTTDEKAKRLMELSGDEMNAMAKKYKDIKPVDLSQECPDTLEVFEFPEEMSPETHKVENMGYNDQWIKRGIKVRSKKR